MRRAFLAAGLLTMLFGCERHEKAALLAAQPQEAAVQAQAILIRLVDNQNYQALGFDSVDAVKQSALGQPLAVFTIGLDRLKTYNPVDDVNGLLVRSSETIYPVTVKGQVKSSVTIVQSAGGYQPSRFGSAAIITSLAKYLHVNYSANSATTRAPDAGEQFVVRVPALNLYFLGSRDNGKLMLTPVIEDSELHLQAGVAVPAPLMMKELVPLAIAADEFPT